MRFFTLVPLSSLILFSFISLSSYANEGQKVTSSSAEDLYFYPKKNVTAVAKAINHTQVPTQISAQVLSILVQQGNPVTKGQILVTLDCQDNQIRLQQNEAKLAVINEKWLFAKRTYKRALLLKEKNNIGEAELDQSQVNVNIYQQELNQNKAALAASQLAVERCHIKAPFDGIVSARLISVGDFVEKGRVLMKVLEKDNIEIEAQIPLSQLINFTPDNNFTFVSSNKTYPITLNNIVDFIEENSRSKIITFSTRDVNLVAGSEGMVTWQTQQSFLPAHLLTQRNNKYGIFVISKNKAKFVAVENAQEGRPFNINLDKNTQIIIDGRHRVDENVPVTVVIERD